MEPNRLTFFDDLREKLLLLAGGLVSMATLVPLFFNQLSKIVPAGIEASYGVFVLLYFIFPVIFYIIYCSIHDHIGFLKLLPPDIYAVLPMGWWQAIECVGLVVCLVLLLSCSGMASWIFVLLMALLIAQLCRVYLKDKQFYSPVNGAWREFVVLSLTAVSLFTLLFYFNFGKIKASFDSRGEIIAKAGHSFDYYGYQDTLTKYLQAPADSFVDESHQALLDALIQQPDEAKFLSVRLQGPQPRSLRVMDSIVKTACADTCWNWPNRFSRDSMTRLARLILNSNTDSPVQYKVYESALYLQLFVRKSIDGKREQIKDVWAARLANLQWKGLAWLLLLIVASLCLWLFMMNEIKSADGIEKWASAMYRERRQKDVQALTDNVGQIKGFIYVCVLLVIPFFKPIEEKDVSLDRPFLNFGVGAFIDQQTQLSNDKRAGDNSEVLSQLAQIKEQLHLVSSSENATQKMVDSNSMRADSIATNTIRYPDGLEHYTDQFITHKPNK